MTYESLDDVPRLSGEKETLTAFLEWQRATFWRKCEGLATDQLRSRSAPPSSLSLLGLVRHLADVERGWFRRTLAGEDVSNRFAPDNREAAFDEVDTAEPDEAFSAWQEECACSRHIVAAHELEDVGRQRTGREVSLRWILVHMVDEYSRHNGHADLLRERIDGAVGY